MSVKSREFKATGKISLIAKRNLENEGEEEEREPGGTSGAEVIVKYQTCSFLLFFSVLNFFY